MNCPKEVATDLRRSEEALLDPLVRGDRARVEKLLEDDFIEFGSSGRVWTRAQIPELLAGEGDRLIQVEDFECALLADAVALVTYRAIRADDQSGERISTLRSSVWTKSPAGWRMRFHQGTRTL
jgi:hypothetical protein